MIVRTLSIPVSELKMTMRDITHALFNPKTIKKLCSDITITSAHRKAVNEWLQLLEKNQLEKEKQNYFKFALIILKDLLGYPIKEEMGYEVGNVEFTFANKEGRKVVCFEAKGTETKDLFAPQYRDKKEHSTPVKQTWDYMGNLNLDYGVTTNYRDFVLIDKNRGTSKYHFFDFTEIKNNDDKLREFIAIFSRDSIIEKRFVESLYNASVIEEREFTKEFYKLFHETRLMLITEFQSNGIPKEEAIHYAQLFLNRLIFIFFVEDTDKLQRRIFADRMLKVLEAMPVTEHSKYASETIVNFFESLDKGAEIPIHIFGFNGGLFHDKIPSTIYFKDLRDTNFFKDVYQYSELKKHVKLDELSEKVVNAYRGKLNPIISNLLAMDSFDFATELNVNILGHIFEQSLTDLEELKGEEISKRKREGIFYTPEFITDYICRNTIIPHLSKNEASSVSELVSEYSDNIEELEKKFKAIKILDPACGSGAFLLKAVDILLEIHKQIQAYKEAGGKYTFFQKGKKTGLSEQFTLTKWHEEDEARKIIENNIFGVDINEESVEITKLSLFLKIATGDRKLADLSSNIKVGNSLISDSNIAGKKAFDWKKQFEDIVEKGGFSVIIGNPPYGAKLTEDEQKHLIEKFSVGSTDTAQLMMELAFNLLKEDGINGFIIPKAFTFASNWKKIRSLLTKNLIVLVDVGKVWQEVKLEQAVYVLRKNSDDSFYMSGAREEQQLEADLRIEKKDCDLFGFLINGITADELALGKKISSNSEKLEKYVENQRGAMLQSKVSEKGEIQVLGGQQIQRYYVTGSKGYLNRKDVNDDKAYVSQNSVLAQNIVAHIENPVDHVKIISTVPTKSDFVILDTVNQLKVKNNVSPYFLCGLLNSKIINWYAYRFIFAKAIRTMHFDKPVTDRIPIIVENEKAIENEIKGLLENHEALEDITLKFLNNLSLTFKLEKFSNKVTEFYKSDFNDFIKEIEKMSTVRISLKEKDEWTDYFNKQKKVVTDLMSKIKESESKLDLLFYDAFNLNSKETDLIERSMG